MQVRDLIYREILEYHPHMLADYLQNGPRSGPGYMYPSAVRAPGLHTPCAPPVQHCVSWTKCKVDCGTECQRFVDVAPNDAC